MKNEKSKIKLEQTTNQKKLAQNITAKFTKKRTTLIQQMESNFDKERTAL